MGIFKKWFGQNKQEDLKPKIETSNKSTNENIEEKEPIIELHSNGKAKVGDLAISSPMAGDPRFSKKVVLLAALVNDQLLGVTTHEKTNYTLGEVEEHYQGANYPIYIGGPINKDDLFYLHTLGSEIPGSTEVVPGLYFHADVLKADLSAIAERLRLNIISSDDIRFYSGFAYWGVEQLADEIDEYARYLIPATKEDILFADEDTWVKMNQKYYNGFDIQLYPRLKVDGGEEAQSTLTFEDKGEVKSVVLPEDQKLINEPFGDDLRLFFVEDKGVGFQFLQKKQLNPYPEVNHKFLKYAGENTLATELSSSIEIKQVDEHTLMIIAGGNHEADLVLVPRLMDKIHETLGDTMLLAIPARDLLFLCKDNALGMDILRQRIETCFNSAETNGLPSRSIYRRKKGKDHLHKVGQG